MGTYEEKYKDLVKRLNKAREEKGVYTFNTVLDAVAPELKIEESDDERIRKAIRILVLSVEKEKLSILNITRSDVFAWVEKQGEQKPVEWGEEDEKMYKKIETAIDSYYAPFSRDAEEMSEWFKNFKDRVQPQSHWKPSDEQMRALESIFAKHGAYNDDLLSLISDLKKLKE